MILLYMGILQGREGLKQSNSFCLVNFLAGEEKLGEGGGCRRVVLPSSFGGSEMKSWRKWSGSISLVSLHCSMIGICA